MINYTYTDFVLDVEKIVDWVINNDKKYKGIYPVLNGGAVLATKLSEKLEMPIITSLDRNIIKDILVVDDIVDSGKTRQLFKGCDFVSLHVKDYTLRESYPTFFCNIADEWVHYWWEKDESNIEDNITRIIEYIGEDPNRNGLIETPSRVRKAFDFIFSGYKQKPEDVMKVFDEKENYNQIIFLKDIEMFSTCEHHMLSFFGKAHVGYIPEGNRIIGASKLARLVDMYSRRLQIQERIGEQVTNALMEFLKPQGAICVIEAKHLCMQMRGVEKQNSVFVTSSLKGSFLKNLELENKFLRLIKD